MEADIHSLYKKEIHTIPWNKIDKWLNYIDNWKTCDQLAIIVALVMVKNPTLLEGLHHLTASENKWKRRFAVATISNMNHAGRQYPEETFIICKNLLVDKEQVVSKAVGWALREISKKCPEQTVEFLNQNKTIISKKLLGKSVELLPEKQKALFFK